MTLTALPAATAMGAVHLTVADLAREVEYFERRLGFHLHGSAGDEAHLGAGGGDLLVLHGRPDAPRARGTTGLYHFAVLVPTRRELARALGHLVRTRTALNGAADHGVSEAIYLTDPEGNGIEIYRDRPRDEWPLGRDGLRMVTEALDVDSLLDESTDDGAWSGLPGGTRIGHVHLHVARLAEAERFYAGALGFEVTQRYGGSALFLSAGGYHHHLGLNTWAGEGAPAPPADARGLHHFEIALPTAAELERVRDRLQAAGALCEPAGDGFTTADPSGNRLRVVLAGGGRG